MWKVESWNWKILKQVYANPSSRVYRDLYKNVVSELTKAKISLSATHGKQMLFKLMEISGWVFTGMTGSLHIVVQLSKS